MVVYEICLEKLSDGRLKEVYTRRFVYKDYQGSDKHSFTGMLMMSI